LTYLNVAAIAEKFFHRVRRQSRVADRGHDRSVAEIGLDGASVVAVVGELEPAGMPQHVGMHEEREFRSHSRPGNHALIPGYGQRRAARDEDALPASLVCRGAPRFPPPSSARPKRIGGARKPGAVSCRFGASYNKGPESNCNHYPDQKWSTGPAGHCTDGPFDPNGRAPWLELFLSEVVGCLSESPNE
jgi:hypothetical protein